jgi:translation initiation factor 3 subunit A
MSNTAYFHKPELALRRALELRGINQDEAALSILHEVLSSSSRRQTARPGQGGGGGTSWSLVHENIMLAYLDLCLSMQRSREAKDGLHQYRTLAQNQNPASLEKVIRYLVTQAETQCAAAKAIVDAEQQQQQAKRGDLQDSGGAAAAPDDGEEPVAVDDDDDDEGGGFGGASPQAILLSTMSTDPAKSQRDSTLLLPALKFLWETYRTILDILRSNSKLEHVYHVVAQDALKFCRTYQRRMEFRHLCEMLRTHLSNLRQYGNINAGDDDNNKSSHKVRVCVQYLCRFCAANLSPPRFRLVHQQVRGWEGWSSESIDLHLQTRFVQLDTASALHRYTEGFRTVEDIYHILQISHARRKLNPELPPPKAKLMAAYYEKLTTLFWVSENYLFHAFAWYKYYTLCKEFNRKMSDEMKRMQASAVLMAALCIPTTKKVGAAASSLLDKQQKKGQHHHGIASTAEDEIIKQKMSRMATLLGFHTRNPTREALLTEIRAKNVLASVPTYLQELYHLLEEQSDPLTLLQQSQPLLQQLKQESKMDTETGDGDDVSLGRYVKPMETVILMKLLRNLSAAYHTVSMDHLKKLTSGLDMTFETVEKYIVLFAQSRTVSLRIDHRAGCLRFGDAQLESDDMRAQLTVLAKQLKQISVLIHPVVDPAAVEQAMAARREVLFAEVRSAVPTENRIIIDRKNLIEKRKEEAERLIQDKIKEDARIKFEEMTAKKAEEEQRVARELRLREQEKQRKIRQELDNQEKKRFLIAMGRSVDTLTEEQMAAIDTETLQKEHQEKLAKKKEDAERKARETARKLDYLVRAVRIEELPLIQKKYEEQRAKDRERYEAEVTEKLKEAKAQWETDIADRAVLEGEGVFTALAEFEDIVMAGRKIFHDVACREAEKQAEINAEKEKLGRARKRKNDEAKRIAAEKQREKEEEERRRAEEERLKKEELAREKEAKDEARSKEERQRMDEERRKAEESRSPAPPPSGGGKYVPPGRRGPGPGSAPPDGPSRQGGSRFGGDYPGGGRYDGNRPGPSSGGSSYPSGPRPGFGGRPASQPDRPTSDRNSGPSDAGSRWRK